MKRKPLMFGLALGLILCIGLLGLVFQDQNNSGTTPLSTSASAFNTQDSASPDYQEPCYRGDANSNGEITIADVVFLINYLFKSGEPPIPLANGDVDCVKGVTITDAVYIVNYLFKSGDEPCIPPEIFEVSVTSPHQANGIDSAEVTIIFTDSCGNDARPPDFPAESFFDVCLYIGEDADQDSAPCFPVTDNGNGTYTVYLTSTVAGQGAVGVTSFCPPFGPRGATEWEVVLYGANLTEAVRVVDVEQSREEEPRQVGKIVAVAVDSFQNVVQPPGANIVFVTDFGNVDSVTVDESGDFIGWISSLKPGEGTVTITEEYTGYGDVVDIVFPAYHLFPPVRSETEGDSTEAWETPTGYLDIGLNIWNPQEDSLGYYDLLITFDPTMVSFINAYDWDLTDGFGSPSVQIISPGDVRISQAGAGGNSNDLARLLFEPLDKNAFTPVTVNLWNNDPYSLSDIHGDSIYTIEEWWLYSELEYYEIEEDSTKEPKWVDIKLWVAPGADWQNLWNQIANAFKLFRSHAKKCCPMIYEHVLFNYLADSTWDSLTGDNDSLDTRAERDSVRSRCNYGSGYVDVIGAPDDALPGWSGVAVAGDAVIVDGDATATGTTMAHELGHYWGLRGHNDPDGNPWGKDNLMYANKNPNKGKKQCAGLSAEQCSTITANADP